MKLPSKAKLVDVGPRDGLQNEKSPVPAEVKITPHTSARTLRDETIAQIAGKIRALERGEPIAGVVDRERGY